MSARLTSEAIDSLQESLTATGVLAVSGAQAASISKQVVLLNSFDDNPPAYNCDPSGQIRFQIRYAGAIRTEDGSDHVEATGTITYDNCFLPTSAGRIKVNGTLNISAFLGKQPSGKETMREQGRIDWTRESDGATGECQPNWTTTMVVPDMRRFTAISGEFCGSDVAFLQYVETFLKIRRAALTNTPPGLLPPTSAGPSNAVGTWTGKILASNPCSVGQPVKRYEWNGTLSLANNTFTLTWRDEYFETQMVRIFPSNQEFVLTFNDTSDRIVLTGRFSTDYRNMSGAVSGSIDCVQSVRSTNGTFDGHRTGP